MPLSSSKTALYQARIQKLEIENKTLRAETKFLRGNPAIAKGLKGESLIANLISAKQSKSGASHDLEVDGARILLEVKSSSLLNAIPGRPIKRWVWTKLFGERGQKRYHRLLLIGDVDPRFTAFYADPTSPYVIFDLPYKLAVELSGGIKPGRNRRIHLTTNPATVISSRASLLFRNYQISPKELQCRYPQLDVIPSAISWTTL